MAQEQDYESEAQARWSDTPAYRQSRDRMSKYSPEDLQAAKNGANVAQALFIEALRMGYPSDSPQTQAAVLAHRLAISNWYYDCSVEMQKNLAQMYLSDDRLTAHYENLQKGLAQYIHDAIMAGK